MPPVPQETPRDVFSFPFIPNRLADGTIIHLVDIVRGAAQAGAVGDRVCGHTAGSRWVGIVDERIAEWGSGAPAVTDWERRKRYVPVLGLFVCMHMD